MIDTSLTIGDYSMILPKRVIGCYICYITEEIMNNHIIYCYFNEKPVRMTQYELLNNNLEPSSVIYNSKGDDSWSYVKTLADVTDFDKKPLLITEPVPVAYSKEENKVILLTPEQEKVIEILYKI